MLKDRRSALVCSRCFNISEIVWLKQVFTTQFLEVGKSQDQAAG